VSNVLINKWNNLGDVKKGRSGLGEEIPEVIWGANTTSVKLIVGQAMTGYAGLKAYWHRADAGTTSARAAGR